MDETFALAAAIGLFDIEDGDFVSEVGSPVADLFQVARFGEIPASESGLSKARWDEVLGESTESRGANVGTTGTMAKRLGITRMEVKKSADGDLWSYGYKGNELVACRLVEMGAEE